ncbi:hypothetical protein D499_0D00400 [Hanseniaspora uvarum DSM 2768]|nr:hypothetical protein D499_0D00400 [Hanseniaspora uvarum DSM 2768]
MYMQNNNKKANLKKAFSYLSMMSLASAKTLSLPLQIVQGNSNSTSTNSLLGKRNYELPDNIYQAFSLISFEVGGESVSSIVDTGSSVLWVGNSTSTISNMEYLCENSACVDVTTMSPAATDMDYSYPIAYAQGVTVNPEFYESTLTIAGVDVSDFNFGVVDAYPEFNRSVFGLRNMVGYSDKSNLIKTLKSQDFISSEAFSMSYAGPITLKGGDNPVLAEGEIVFGGYNSDVSSGSMETFSIDDNTQFDALTSVSLKSSSSSSSSLATVSVSGKTVLDSGTTTALIIPGLSSIIDLIENDNGIWTCSDYEDYVVQLGFGTDVLEIPLNNLAGQYGDSCYMFFSDADIGVNIIGQFVMTNIVSYWDYDTSVVGIKPLDNYASWVSSTTSTTSTSSAATSTSSKGSSTSSAASSTSSKASSTSSKASSTSSAASSTSSKASSTSSVASFTSSKASSTSSVASSTSSKASSTSSVASSTSSKASSTSSVASSTSSKASSTSSVASSTSNKASSASSVASSTSSKASSTSSKISSTFSAAVSSTSSEAAPSTSSEAALSTSSKIVPSTSSAIVPSTSSEAASSTSSAIVPSTSSEAASSTSILSTTSSTFSSGSTSALTPLYSNTTSTVSSTNSALSSVAVSSSSSVTETSTSDLSSSTSSSRILASTTSAATTNVVTKTSSQTSTSAATSALPSNDSPIGKISFLPNSLIDGLAKFGFLIEAEAFDTIIVIAKAAEGFILDLDNIFAGTQNKRIAPSKNFSTEQEAYMVYDNFDADTFQFSLYENAKKSGVTSVSQQFDIYVPVNNLKRDTAYMKISILATTSSSGSSILSTSVVTALEAPLSSNSSSSSTSASSTFSSTALTSSSATTSVNASSIAQSTVASTTSSAAQSTVASTTSSAAQSTDSSSVSTASGKLLTASLQVVASSASASLGAVPVSTEYQSSDVTTVVTITSCSDNKCSKILSTALESIATTTIEGVSTEYTTYCPLTTDITSSTVKAVVSSTSAPQVATVTSSQAGNTTVSVTSLYEGAAVQKVGSLAVIGLVGLLFV